jgi:pterin-4a-carbinolamine dehydratase
MTKKVEYWDSKDNCLNRTFEFKNFLEAIEFINDIQLLQKRQFKNFILEIICNFEN